jgi:hypothetical protein
MARGVKDKDKGYRDLVKRLYGIKAPKIEVGIFEQDGAFVYADGSTAVTVLDVAMWNEFGTGQIPERSFLRAWFDENQDKCRELVRRLLESVIAGTRTKEQALELLGVTFVGQIQKRIADGISPANAPATIARKGSDKPLIDTGQLRSSVTHRVR